jgi:histone acetyltransferase (RNA polymerase elongator complex component)
MPGLPGDGEEAFRATITKIIRLSPDMVRLYPAVVLRGTGLAEMHRQGRYRPLGLGEAVRICSEACMRFEGEGIPVIRMGLMSSPSLLLQGQIVAGPWHPAFGFLVRSTVHHRLLEPTLPRSGVSSTVIVEAPQREIPLVRGFRNQGLRWIEKRIGAKVVRVEPDDSVPPGRVRVREV